MDAHSITDTLDTLFTFNVENVAMKDRDQGVSKQRCMTYGCYSDHYHRVLTNAVESH